MFELEGYRVDIPVKIKNGDDQLVPGPAGIPIRLFWNIPDAYNQTVLTDDKGIATFGGVPEEHLHAFFLQDKPETGEKLYSLKLERF